MPRGCCLGKGFLFFEIDLNLCSFAYAFNYKIIYLFFSPNHRVELPEVKLMVVGAAAAGHSFFFFAFKIISSRKKNRKNDFDPCSGSKRVHKRPPFYRWN